MVVAVVQAGRQTSREGGRQALRQTGGRQVARITDKQTLGGGRIEQENYITTFIF